MLLGDSHAAQFAPVFRRAAEMQGVRVRSIALGGCAPLPGKLVGVVSDSRLTACEEGMPQVLARAQDFPLLIIGGAWATYSQNDPQVWDRLEAHLRDLVARGHQVWLLPRVPAIQGYDAACLAKRLRVGDWLKCPTTLPQTAPNDNTNTRLTALARSIQGVKFLSLQPEPGPCSGANCEITDAQGRFLYSDGSHLNILGVEKLTNELVLNDQLPDMRAN